MNNSMKMQKFETI